MSNASFIALLLGQILSSLQRKSFQVASPYIIKEFEFTKSNIGTISSSFSFNYGITKFVGGIKQQLFVLLQQLLLLTQYLQLLQLLLIQITSKTPTLTGILSDFLSCELLFTLSILFASISLIGFANGNCLLMLCLLWSLHGLFQGISGPAITKLVVQLSLNNNTIITIDTIWSILICAGNLGYLIGPFILLPIIDNHDWKFCYKILGLVGIFISGLIHLMISNNNDIKEKKKKIKHKTLKISTKNGLLNIFMKTKFWFILLSSSLTYFSLLTMANWTYLYLVEKYKISALLATELMLYNEIGGIFGTFICGIISISFGRLPTAISFSLICSLSLLSLQYISSLTSSSSTTLSFKILLFIAGATVNGPKTLIPLTVTDFSDEYSGTVGGIIGLISQIGCVLAGYWAGLLIDSKGWQSYLLLLSVNMLLVTFTLSIAYIYSDNDQKKKKI